MTNIPEWANWLARDEDGALYAFKSKPKKNIEYKHWNNPGGFRYENIKDDEGMFNDVKWTDREPTRVDVPKNCKNDPVNRPNHYIGVEGMEVREVQENFVPKYEKYGAMVMCDIKDAIKYITRAPDKNEVQDIDKAIRMLQYAKVKMTENIDNDISTFYGGTNPND